MPVITPFLPEFPKHLFGSAKRSLSARLLKQLQCLRQNALFEVASLAEPFLAPNFFTAQDEVLPATKQDIYTRQRTFWAFLWQTLSPDASCRKAVRKLQCLWHREKAPGSKRKAPSGCSGGYCLARKRLEASLLEAAHGQVRDALQRRRPQAERWCGRLVKVADGTGLSMPDTPENQEAFPQSRQQKMGCGFPTLKLVGIFCLHTGAWLHWAIDSLRAHEAKIWKGLWKFFQPGDVVLADRGFSSYGSLAGLLSQGVDVVFRAHQAKNISFREGTRLAADDRVQTWKRPQFPQNGTWEKKAWAALPEELRVRVVRFRVQVPGWRSEEIVLCTTLIDATIYSYEKLAELYLKRWAVELYFRDLKTTLGMDILRCKTPEMVKKEVAMYAIAYNVIRALIYEASLGSGLVIELLSFKGTLDTLRTWETEFHHRQTHAKLSEIRCELLAVIARDALPFRPWRSEPRAVKRRPKAYQLLTSPRHEMKVALSRKQS